MKSKFGLVFGGAFLLIAIYLIATQGLFGESFVALMLGMPWALIPAYFEYGGDSGPLVYFLLVVPILINACILYGVGSFVGRLLSRTKPPAI